MSELRKRWAVAVIAIPIVLVLAYLGGWYFAVPLSGFAAWAAHECYRLAVRKGIDPLGGIGSVTAAGFVLAAGWKPAFSDFASVALALLGGATVLVLVGAMLFRGPDRHPLSATAVTLFGSIYAGLSLAFMPLLRGLPEARGWAVDASEAWAGLFVLALPLVATWVGDAAALFAGTAWGKKKLAPSISPNKSWVGFWASLVGAAVVAVIWAEIAETKLPQFNMGPIPVVALVGALIGLSAVTGDLVESLLKREAGVKDSGTFFPGHGGVIDRIDSLMFTVPTAYCLLIVIGGSL